MTLWILLNFGEFGEFNPIWKIGKVAIFFAFPKYVNGGLGYRHFGIFGPGQVSGAQLSGAQLSGVGDQLSRAQNALN